MGRPHFNKAGEPVLSQTRAQGSGGRRGHGLVGQAGAATPLGGEWSHRASPHHAEEGLSGRRPSAGPHPGCVPLGSPPSSPEPTLGDSPSHPSQGPGSAQCILAPGSWRAKWPPGRSVPLSFPFWLLACHPKHSCVCQEGGAGGAPAQVPTAARQLLQRRARQC